MVWDNTDVHMMVPFNQAGAREMTDRELQWKTNENHYCLSKLMKSGTVLIYLFFDCMNLRAALKGYLPCQVKPLNVSSPRRSRPVWYYVNEVFRKGVFVRVRKHFDPATNEGFKLRGVYRHAVVCRLRSARGRKRVHHAFVCVTGLFSCFADGGECLRLTDS